MTDRQLKLGISQLPDEELFKMVNEDIVHHGKKEITLAYDELDRRGLLPAVSDETPPPTITRLGCLMAVIVFMVEFVLIHHSLFIDKSLLPLPRAAALASFVGLVASYWEKRQFGANFAKHLLWSVGLVLLGSLALWDLPNLLRQRIPIALAFGIPATLFAVFWYWLYESYLPRSRQKELSETEK